MNPTARTRLLAVIGDPVEHSLSPLIHNRWLQQAGIDALYMALRLESADAASDLAALARAGFLGLNVTLPHKAAALACALDATPEARRIGSANTLVRKDAGWMAHNTDVEGFRLMLERTVPQGVRGASVLVVGAGGAARSAVHVLFSAGARVTIANRTRSAADLLAAQLCPGSNVCGLEQFAEQAKSADILVQTTSSGHAGADLPELPDGHGRPALDLSYGDASRTFLATAARAGWTIHDGLPMLVGQAAVAFRLWFGVVPNMHIAEEDCRNALANLR